MATRDDALRNVFLFIRDTNTGRVTRTVIPGDLQVGLRGNPASLELGGKLAIKVTDYTVNAVNKGIINVMPEDTVVSVNIDEVPESNQVQIILPANPTKGEIHFIKDVSGLAASGLPIKVLPQGSVTIDGAEEKEIIDAFGSLAVFWFRGLWRVLVAGVGLATGGTAPINSAYVTIGNDATLTNERRVAASSNIGFTDAGANASVSFDLTDTGVAATTYTAATVTVDAKGRITAAFSNQLGDANAEYIVASATGSLPNAKTLVAGPNITINDEGTQLSITGSASGGGSGDSQARYVVTEETGSLPNAYRLVAGPNIIINSGSGLVAITGSGGSGNSVWSDVGDQIFTTASVAIGIPNVASSQGSDIVFFVSGAISGSQKSVFGGDVRISGSLLVGTGSLHLIDNEIKSTDTLRLYDKDVPLGVNLADLISGGSGDGDSQARYVITEPTGSLPNAYVIEAGPNITINSGSGIISITGSAGSSGTGADPGAQYVVMAATASLPNERVLTPGTGLTLNDGGAGAAATLAINDSVVATLSGSLFTGPVSASAGLSGSLQEIAPGLPYLVGEGSVFISTSSNGQVIISVSAAGGGDPGAEYIVNSLTASLPNALKLEAGPNITINSGSGIISITGSAGGSGGGGDPDAEYIVNSLTASLPNALKIEAGPNITIASGSGFLAVSGTIGVPPLSATYTLNMLAGVATTATALSESKLTIGSTYFDPDQVTARLGVNDKTYTWRAIIESSELPVSAAIDLYDVNGIIGIPGGITGSILSSSVVSPTFVEFDLTSQFEGITTPGIIEARLWKTVSGSTTSSVTSKGAWLDVTAPVQNQQVDFQAVAGSSTTSTALSSSKQTIGALYFDLNKVEEISGTRVFEWTTILHAKETLVSAAIDLYDVNGIVTGIPGVITGSILSSSAQTPTYLFVDLTSQLTSVTGSGVFEARLWKTVSGSVTSSVTCNNARLTVRN